MRVSYIPAALAVSAVFVTACSSESPYGEKVGQATSKDSQAFPAWSTFCNPSTSEGLRCLRDMGNHNNIMGIDRGADLLGDPAPALDQVFQYDGQHIVTWDGHCLDDFAFGLTDSPVNAWECNGKANQNWSLDLSTGMFHGWGGECLELVHSNDLVTFFQGPTAWLRMEPCDSGQLWQKFAFDTLSVGFGLCTMTTMGGAVFRTCTNISDHVQPYYPAAVDLTLDVQWNGRANGTPVWVWTNNESSAQDWIYDSFTQALSLNDGSESWCLEKPLGQNDPGTPVQLSQCIRYFNTQTETSHAAANQSWELAAPNQLVNVESGLCLDAQDGNFNAGAAVTVQNCTGAVNQQWRMISFWP
jgi:Ricin-type beta-trefoil lectin domain